MKPRHDALKPLSLAKSRLNENWLSVLLVVIVTLLTYAPLISQLGFYRDDWYLIWTAQTQGVDGILSLFKGDRPFLGWLYVFDYKLLGSAPLNWHLYALLIKTLGGLAFLWLMRSLWPNKKIETTVITLLFVVYPGFYQQPNALTFKNLLLAYAVAISSLALTVQALKARSLIAKISLMILAVSTAAFYIFIYEALIGLEAVRLLFIWYYLKEQGFDGWKTVIRRVGREMFPYLLFAAGFVYWRIFLFQSTRRSTNVDVVFAGYGELPLHYLTRLIVETAKDLIETTFLAWGVPYYQFTVSQRDYRLIASAGMFVLLMLGALALYYFLVRDQVEVRGDAGFYPQAEFDWLVLGTVVTVLTTIPIILAGRDVIFGIQWDRYTYQSVLGVVLLIGGFLFYAVRGNLRWWLVSALLLSGMLTQFFSADFYRNFWSIERGAMWQLSWRAPQIEDGTTVILSLPQGYRPAEEYEVWGPLNLVYHPDDTLKLAGQVIFADIWPNLARGIKEERLVRGTVSVVRDYGAVIILSQPAPRACLHVLDGRRLEQTATEPLDVQLIAQYSNVMLVHDSGVQTVPPGVIFGSEPAHDWCYFYQKMDLARQQKNWQVGAKLSDQAISLGLEPADISEWLPALEAYIHVNNAVQARKISRFIQTDKNAYLGICQKMKSLEDQPAGYDRKMLSDVLCKRD